ncbi:MAG: glycosyltransferase [Xenococcaceae cyanobacterium]
MSNLDNSNKSITIAVAIPCYNEEITIAKVVRDFQAALPKSSIHVFDNNSTDGSAKLAKAAGATVHHVRKRGKGWVMQAIFNKLKADALIVVDGDDTYYAKEASRLLEPILRGEADMVVGNRRQKITSKSMRKLHQMGNYLIVKAINLMFDSAYQDILSGYRAFSRNFVESVPILTPGFETETELTLRALVEEMDVVEVPISYQSRPAGSYSKLQSFQDGYRIMLTSAILLRDLYPLRLFGMTSFICLSIVLMAGTLRFLIFIGIPTLSTSLLTGLILLFAPLSLLTFGIGIILNAINTRFREMNQLLRRTQRTNV